MERIHEWRTKLATPVVRNSAYLIATEVVAGSLGLVFWVVAARLFTDADVGVGAALISSATLLAILSTLGFNISLVRFIPEGKPSVIRLINSSVTIGSVVAALLAIAFGLATGAWFPVLGFLAASPALLGLFAFFTAVWTVSLLFDAAFIGLGEARYVLLRAAIYNLLKIPLPFALAAAVSVPFALFSAWGLGLLVANVVAANVLFVSALPAFRLRPDLDRHAVGSMMRYSFANHAANVLGAAPGFVFPLIVLHALRREDVAYFYLAWVLANFVFIIPGSIFTSVFAEGSRWRPGLRGNALDGLFLSLALQIPAVATVLLVGPWFLSALRPTFLAALPLLNVLAASSFFAAINILYVAILRVEKRMGPVLAIYAGTTFAALALGWPLLLALGLVGAGLGFAVAQGAGAAYSLWAMIREGSFQRSA